MNTEAFMRGAMYYNNHDIRIEEMETPQIGPGELLVKVMASSICGSDVMEWYRLKKAPLILGHEITGEIVKIGERVTQFKVGDRISATHHVPCNTCIYCLNGKHTVCETLHTTNYDPGGFAEYLRIPKINVDRGVFILNDNTSYEEGAFVEPLGCVIRGQRLAQLQPGQTVLILGSGISGLLHIALARATGAGRIIGTDINEYRLDAARRFGADAVIHANENVPQQLLKINENRLADLVIICTGAYPAFIQALKSVDRGGTVLFFAPTDPGTDLSIPVNEFWRNQVTLMTSYGAAPLDLKVAIDLISAKRLPLNEMITHRLSLAETDVGFRLVAEGGESIKVIVEPQR